jgi:hypothetical protein
LATEDVVGVHLLAKLEGQAPAADASAQPIPEVFEPVDPVVKIVAPGRRQALPVPSGRVAVLGQPVERRLDPTEGNAGMFPK